MIRPTLVLALAAAAVLAGCTFQPRAATADSSPDAGAELGQDAGAAIGADVSPDAARIAHLVQTTSSVASPGRAIWCSGGSQTIRDNAWYRAFTLSDFGIAGPLHLTTVHVAAEQSRGASITVHVLAYAGDTGETTLDTSMMSELAAASVAVPNSDTPQEIDVAIAAAAPADSTIAIEVAGSDTYNSQGTRLTYFHLGANAAGQTAPGYFASGACGEPSPSSQTGADFIISAEGTY